MVKLLLSIMIAGTCASLSYAQKTITVDELLTSYSSVTDAVDKNSIDAQKEKITFIKEAPANTPFIDNVQLRYKLDDFTFEKHEFKLRFQPRGLGEGCAHTELKKSNLSYQDLKLQRMESKLLRKRYRDIIKYNYLKAVLKHEKNLLLILEDKMNISKKQIDNVSFDFDAIITYEDDITKTTIRIIDLEDRLRELSEGSGISLKMVIDTTNQINTAFIDAFIKNETFPMDSTNHLIKEKQLRYNVTQQKLNVEKAENRNIISYFDVSYEYDRFPGRVDYTEEHFSAGVGIDIPFISTNHEAVNKRKLDLLEEREELFELKILLNENIKDMVQSLKIANRQLKMLTARRDEVSRDSYLENIMKINGISPIKLLNAKESIIQMEKRVTDTEYDVLRNYIDLLDISGKLYAIPYINYLNRSLTAIQ